MEVGALGWRLPQGSRRAVRAAEGGRQRQGRGAGDGWGPGACWGPSRGVRRCMGGDDGPSGRRWHPSGLRPGRWRHFTRWNR